MRVALIPVLCLAPLSAAQAPQPDPLAPVRFLEGRWEGEAKGQPGNGKSHREYRFELRGRFLVGKSQSEYPAQPGKANPEVHEDWSILSFDRVSKRLMLRQFHVEGFVNEYALSSAAGDTDRLLEFTTFRIDNLPEGWRAREVYRIVSKDEFVESFLLAPPGKDFEPYSETRFRRLP